MIYPNRGIIQIDLKQERTPTTTGLLEGATAAEVVETEEAEEDVVLCIVQPLLDRPSLVEEGPEEGPSIVAQHKQTQPNTVRPGRRPNCTD